ncbi:hypothetical protein IGI04_023901 [Brassica rapa subsp. trilocularis]|uniref:Uncharacterized protein n=1 Tax=Brassica rapa subsp. trilocularis TaxID=1813537 RepID=A0ABQ7M560_BRACM|nr:hypothetical protein IGI04_023901 [Brassica rapa subsp. trilocularis]
MMADGGVMLKSSAASLFLLCSVIRARLPEMRLKKMCQHEQELAITPTPKEDKDLADLDIQLLLLTVSNASSAAITLIVWKKALVNLTLGLDLGYKIKVSCPFIVYWFRALAQQSGFDDLVAYVAEICLLAQLNDMKIAGNLKSSGSYSGSIKRKGVFNGTVKGDKVYQHGAKSIIVATKMHNAFCKYDMRRNVKASYRIHCRFQTWKIQREFFGMWSQAIRIQAVAWGDRVSGVVFDRIDWHQIEKWMKLLFHFEDFYEDHPFTAQVLSPLTGTTSFPMFTLQPAPCMGEVPKLSL